MSIVSRASSNRTIRYSKFSFGGESPYANAKVWSLEQMQRVAKYKIFVVSDSDVSGTSGYLRAVVAPLADEKIALVTCLYRGVPLTTTANGSGSLWSTLEAVGMSVELSSGVLVAEMLERMKFALGPTMVIRRDPLEKAGGFPAIGEYHGDDFMLGNLMAAHGHRVVLSTHAVNHHILSRSFVSSARRQIRWMKGTRLGNACSDCCARGMLGRSGAKTLAKYDPLSSSRLAGFFRLERKLRWQPSALAWRGI